jgi:hypothetical protein
MPIKNALKLENVIAMFRKYKTQGKLKLYVHE